MTTETLRSAGDCVCHPRPATQGCTEWTCPYHGEENRRKAAEQRAACPVHGALR